MKDLTNEQILYHLKQNTISRNKQLSVLVKLLNSRKENTVLAIDGPWGSGKTVFVKQLLMLADNSVEDYGHNTLDDVAIKKLRETQKVFYFNAWENDYIGDALGAILLKLVAEDDESLNLASIKRAAKIINISAGIKNVSHDFIDFSANTTKEKLVKGIQAIVDRHDAVNDFINKIKGDKDRVIFVVDELDRCKPSFAVDLLEVMKHYFIRDDITFILTINTKELAHTIQKYYGYNFDGYAYLNKFFDYALSLIPVDIDSYSRLALKWNSNGMVDQVAQDAIRYFHIEMREINVYYSAIQLVSNFLNRNNNWEESQWIIQLIFVPVALALKTKNDPRFTKFVSGSGSDLLREFLPSSNSILSYVSRLVKDQTNLNELQLIEQKASVLISHYEDMFRLESGRRQGENIQNFNDAVALLSSFTTISESEGER